MTQKRQRVSGVDRVFQLLDHLMQRSGGAKPLEIARELKAPVSTTYEMIDDLVARRILVRDDHGLVSLGPRLLHYGLAYEQATPLLPAAKREMRRLCAQIGESVQICGRDDDMMIVLGMANGPGPFTVTSHIGSRVPLNWTASGLLLTGHLARCERIDLYRRSAAPSPTGRAVTDPELLAAASERALRKRLSVQVSAADFGVACVAAPIVNYEGECVATISIVVPEIRAKAEHFAQAVQSSAQAIEAELGWDGQNAVPTQQRKSAEIGG